MNEPPNGGGDVDVVYSFNFQERISIMDCDAWPGWTRSE
ncbi:hypothetical protein Q31b_47010 [Novipirellula aureliae]|uniref:Uncharacterized protein n=1 Tax=Novipirellula aureliae TaxID=2527966 RepID=A0A5C6DMN3_9BACT|nr:hypothetical protein Q31b_47010 [Novipirellula aureliae]